MRCRWVYIIIISLIMHLFAAVEVYSAENEKYFYRLIGYSENKISGQTVSVNIFYPGKTIEDLETSPADEVIVYHTQLLTDAAGCYELDFSAEEDGVYFADVRCAGEKIKRVKCEKITEYTGTAVFDMDFETIPSDLIIKGTVGKAMTDAEHGYALVATPRSVDVSVWKFLDESVKDGVYLLEYDTKFTGTGNYSYVRLLNKKGEDGVRNNLFEGFAFDTAGNMGYFNELRGWNLISAGEYVADTWYNIKMWIDLEKYIVYYYVNGNYAGSTYIHCDLDEIWGFEFITENDTGDMQYWDNISLRKADYSLLHSMPASEIPNRFLDKIGIEASDRVTGNIYFEKNADFYFMLSNHTDEEKDIEIKYELLNGEKDCIMSGSKYINIKAGSEDEICVPVEFDKFGLYEMKITVTSDDIYNEKILKLSCVNGSDTVSADGVCTHFGQNKGGVSELMPLVKNSGLGFIRDEIYWSEFEKEKGVYEIPQKNLELINYANEMGIEILQVLTYSNALYGEGDPWENDNVLAGYEEYCYQMALALKGKVKYFEIWNEYDLNGEYGVDGYIRLLKAGYNGVKRANSSAKVIAIAPLDVGFAWISKVLPALNGERYMDIIAIHPYNDLIPEHDDLDWGYVGKFNKLRWRMNYYGYGDLPVWATELGWPDNIIPQQPEYTVRLSLLNTAHGMMDKMFFYDFQDDGADLSNNEHNYGMVEVFKYVDVPYAAKETYLAISNYNHMLGGAQLLSYTENENGNYIYKYLTAEGKILYALWNIYGEESQITIEDDGGNAVIYDLYGNPKYQKTNEGKVSLTLSDVPLYLEFTDIEISLTIGGETIESLAGLESGDIISIKAENLPEDTDLFVAGYTSDGYMAMIEKISGTDWIEMDIEYDGEYAVMKFFLWKNGKPLTESVELTGEEL